MPDRDYIVIRGIPYRWSTNLDEDDVREFYEHYSESIKEPPVPKPASVNILHIPLRFGFYDLKDGYCFWCANGEEHIVIYRSEHEWAIWNARQKELHELVEEREIELSVEEQILTTEDEHLKKRAEEAIANRDFERATSLIDGRISIRLNCIRLKELSDSWRVKCLLQVSHLWWAYTKFPTAEPGIECLLKYDRQAGAFTSFALWYAARCGLEREACIKETLRIYDTAKRLYPDDGSVAKAECLFLRRIGKYDLAIKLCRDAIRRGLKDDTKSGFTGRLKRLESEASRHA